ncbi:MAG TPA: flagellar assembly protein FliW, partial [Gemmatimonadaceae bacterium]
PIGARRRCRGIEGVAARLPEMTPVAPLVTDPANVETRFGRFATGANAVITLVEGLPGFEGCRTFLVLSSPEIEPLTCLQGLDEQKPAFLAIDPRMVDPGYPCRLDDLQRQRLGATASTMLLWRAIVRVADGDGSTVNLRAPLVINPDTMRGLQLLAGHDQYDTDHRLG